MKRWQGLLLGLAVSIAALWLALRSVDLTAALRVLAHAEYAWVLPSVAIFAAGLFTRAVRWRALLDDRIPLARSFSILNISYLLNGVLPARLGEVARAFLTTRLSPPIPAFTSLSTILAERILDMLMVLLMLGGALLALPHLPPGISRAGSLMGLASIGAFMALLVFAHRPGWAHALLGWMLKLVPLLERLELPRVLDRILDGLKPLTRWRSLFRVALWTGISWLLSTIAGYVLMYTVFENPRLDAALLFITAASLVIAMPATVASVGPFEWSVVVSLVAVYGIDLHTLPTTFIISPLARNPGAIATVMAVHTRAFSFAVVLHVVNVSIYAILGALGLVQEGISLKQVTRGAHRIETLPEA